jgi:uncharacterized protein YukE
MGNVLKVSCKEMKNDAEALSAALTKIPETIEQLQISMRKLYQCWEGPAWEAFQVQVNKDIQNMYEVYEILVALQKALGKGRDIYLRTEYDIYTDIKSLWI